MLVLEESRPIEFLDSGLLVKTLSDEQDLSASYQLRHQVFAERLQWVAKTLTALKWIRTMHLPHRLGCLTTTGSFVASFEW